MTGTRIRSADPGDRPFLLAMLVEAANWNGQLLLTPAEVEADPALAHYISGWGRPFDFGVVALNDAGEPMGAAWARSFDIDDPGYGFVAKDIPEISMAVVTAFRGQGVGTRLLAALIREARGRGHDALSLSVEDGNPARILYERAGFLRHSRNGNSDTMLLKATAGALGS
ncbi:GNAT family N-acetyltransferase [Jatrophihabitans sp.]|jgi:GNAT superfamily N-acetyltransferase|uniref:GNAT family N-acetyltransferase n=1 Tax=Jatrophihabitans sp. TaxID=1932789 RepID=UPI002F10E556